MAFENIKQLPSQVTAGTHYFLDANVWVYVATNSLFPRQPDKGNPVYTSFFHKIIDSETSGGPRIILCSVLMSEIVNTYLKKFALADYLYLEYKSKSIPIPPNFDYKTHYRKTEHYDTNLRLILNEIKSYNTKIVVVSDEFQSMKPFQFARNCPVHMDFNDYYYYQLTLLLKKKFDSFVFVTNDGDFKINDVEIYTASKALLDLKC